MGNCYSTGERDQSKATGIILLADGSNSCLDSNLNEALASTDYALLHASNGLEAIAILDLLKSEIELAIIEEQFPAVNGIDLVGGLAMREQAKPVKIMTTEYDRPYVHGQSSRLKLSRLSPYAQKSGAK